jgi:oligopeptide/dipeptide ABC transporter ATP-binding protein
MATKIQMVFQDPSSALNPRQAIGSTLMEPLLVHKLMSKQQARARVSELLELVGIPPSMRDRYPHELNSGQRQRVVIARTLTLNPEVLVADEPVSRLDVSMQSQILNLLLTLHRDLALTVIFITHDLSVVRQVADRVVVMYLGRIMETCSADAFFARPSHPYSQALVTSTPRFLGEAESMPVLQGEIPSPIHPPPGCPFATRCPEVVDACNASVPLLHEVAPGQAVACIRRTASTDAVQVATPQPAQPMS